MDFIRSLHQKPLYRYIFIGGISYLIEVALLALLLYSLKLSAVAAVAISFWIGFILSFLLQKLIAFKNTDSSKKTVARQSVLYSLLVAVNYLFTLAFVAALGPLIGTIVARTIALIVTTGWNYVVYSKFIFKGKDEKK